MATTSHIRRLNQRQVVMALLRQRRASRAELAKFTGMSQPTVGRIVDDLISGQILAEAETDDLVVDQTMLGRPSQLLELDRSHHRFAAIQIGVKSTRIALLPAAIADTDKWDLQIPTPSTAISWAAAVAQAWRELAGDDVELILLSVPGVVDETEGRVLLSPNLRWSQYIALRELLQMAELPATDQSVVIVQEIRALALGHMAVDPSSHDFLLVDFGNGVGAAAVVGGELYHGALALSGELGHTPVLGQHARVRVRIGPDALKRWCRGTVFSPLSRPFTNRSRPGSSCSITLQLWASSRGWGMRSTPSRSRSPVH